MKVVLNTGEEKFLTHISRQSDEQSVTRKFEKMLRYSRTTINGLSDLRAGLQRSLDKHLGRYRLSDTDENLNRLKTVLNYALKLNVFLIQKNIRPLFIPSENGLLTKEFLEGLFSTAQPGECIAYRLGNKFQLAVKPNIGTYEILTNIEGDRFKYESVPFGVSHQPLSQPPKDIEVTSPLTGKKRVRFNDQVQYGSPVKSFQTTSAEFIRLIQHDKFTFLPFVNSKLSLTHLPKDQKILYPVVGLSGDPDLPFIYFENQSSEGVRQEGPESHLKPVRSSPPHSHPPCQNATPSIQLQDAIRVKLSASEVGTAETFWLDRPLAGFAIKAKNGEIIVGQYFYDTQPAQVSINGLRISWEDLCTHRNINFSVDSSVRHQTSFYTIHNKQFGEKYKFHRKTGFRPIDLNTFLSRFRESPASALLY